MVQRIGHDGVEQMPVSVPEENILPMIPAGSDVIDGARNV